MNRTSPTEPEPELDDQLLEELEDEQLESELDDGADDEQRDDEQQRTRPDMWWAVTRRALDVLVFVLKVAAVAVGLRIAEPVIVPFAGETTILDVNASVAVSLAGGAVGLNFWARWRKERRRADNLSDTVERLRRRSLKLERHALRLRQERDAPRQNAGDTAPRGTHADDDGSAI